VEQNEKFNSWIESFLNHLFSKRPVDATFAGKNEYNHMLSDVSKEGLAGTLQEIKKLLSKLSLINRDSLDRFQKIDYDLAEGFLKTQEWERESGYFYSINPTTYTGEAAFGLVSLFISDFRPASVKAKCLESRMKALPEFFKSAMDNLTSSHPAWIARAVDECVGGINFLEKGIPILKEDEDLQVDVDLVSKALLSFKEFKAFLENDLPNSPDSPVSAGKEVFDNIMKFCHWSNVNALEYADHAEAIIAECNKKLAEGAGAFGASTPEEAMKQLSNFHPETDGYLDAYKTLWEETRILNEREQFVTWSNFPIEYKPIARWARDVQPFLYFLFYRCPPIYNRPDVYKYHVIPIEKDMSEEMQESLLRGNNTTAIKTNHVLHHGGIGHHVQNWNAIRSKSLIGQVAANDGPARLTMLCSGTLTEGWACYISGLAGSKGFLTDLEEYAELSANRRMAARAVVDVRLHYGIYTLEDAARYYRENAKMPEDFAMSEAVKNSLFPGCAIIYLYGVESITNLREELKKKKGADFSLKAFHDEFLSYGGIPVDRTAEEMRKTF
jgi:hypothetical protein